MSVSPAGVFNTITGHGSEFEIYIIEHLKKSSSSTDRFNTHWRERISRLAGMRPIMLELREKMQLLY